MRLTGGEFAAGRLPENYYGQFIRIAQQGGMAAVCATPPYRERIKANAANETYLTNLDVDRYVAVMSRWRDLFVEGARLPVMGVSEADLTSINVPTIIIPGNDLVHSSESGRVAHRLIPQSEIYELPIEDQDVPLVPFDDWAPHEDEITNAFVAFMRRVDLHEN